MNNLGVEIGGNFVSFAELRSDVQACYRKGMGSNFCFLPATVEALLDYIAAQQSVQADGVVRCQVAGCMKDGVYCLCGEHANSPRR
jgi:hypothetical protein